MFGHREGRLLGPLGAKGGRMEKGSFSVEWLARSSHQPASGAGVSPSPQPGGRGGAEGSRALLPGRSPAAPPEPEPEPEPEPGGEGAQPGRPRTKFSAAQLQELERSFRQQRYIGASEKRRLSKVLNLSQTQIKTWFQNRRMKFKRQTQDARVEALFSGLLLPYHRYPEIQSPSYLSGVEFSVSSSPTAGVTCSLHPAMPSPALLLPPAPAQSLQPIVPTPALLLPAAPGFSSYHSAFPKVSVTQDHNRLRFQTYLPPS